MVTDALTAYLAELEGNPLANTWGGLGSEMEQVRAKGAEFIGGELDEVVLTRNTTEGMNHVASGLDLQPGDEVLTTNHEHGGGMVCWQHLARTRGVVVRCIKMPNPVRDAAQILQRVEDHLTPRTRVCSFSHIDTITGLQMPLAAIAALTRPRDILLVCDGAQAPGMIDVDVKALGVDTYASSSHKWMLAPKGTGLLYIRKEVQDRVRPVFTYSGYSAYSASSGTRNVPQIVAHGVAMEFHNTIGRPRVEARCRQPLRLRAPTPSGNPPSRTAHPAPARAVLGHRQFLAHQRQPQRSRRRAAKRNIFLNQRRARTPMWKKPACQRKTTTPSASPRTSSTTRPTSTAPSRRCRWR